MELPLKETRPFSSVPSHMERTLSPSSPSKYDFLLRRPSAIFETQFEDAILGICSATSAVEFKNTVSHALRLALTAVRHSLVLFLDLEAQELAYFESDTQCIPMTKSGVVWEAVRRRVPEVSKLTIPEDDPIRTFLPDLQPLDEQQVVLINPIVEKKQHRVIALLLAVCEEPTSVHMHRLKWLERNVLVAASRVLKHVAAERERTRAESMLYVCGDLIDLDTVTLSVKILKHLKDILKAEMCYLFLLDDSTHELVCQVLNHNPLNKELRVPITSESLYGRCYLTAEVMNIEDVSKDARFNPTVDIVNSYEPSSMLCLPVVTQREGPDDVIAVAVACNKKGTKIFSTRDQDNMSFVLRFCSSVLANTLAFQREITLKKQNLALLQVARNLFSHLSEQDVLLREIMMEARQLTKAEKCSLFLLDEKQQELVATVFDSHLPDKKETLRIKADQGIAGYVARSGKLVNIQDAYKHPKFFKDVDKNTGFHTRNMLCFPIQDNRGCVVGVAELVNKTDGNFFTKYDEELAMTFSVYCGISIYQSKLYNRMTESQGRSKLATELMVYHMQVSSEEEEKLVASLSAKVKPCVEFHTDFTKLVYSPRGVPDVDTPVAVLSMMSEMGLISRWKLEQSTLARFILMVKKGYRDTPYHNWYHAFSVAHFSYVLHQQCDRLSLLSDLEVLALFISCLCHDIDHRGTNNAFQVSSNSVLASLYSSEGSVMERHHFSQTLCILNSEGCNILENLSPEEYKKALDLIHHIILATDIATHLRHFKGITEMANGGYDVSNSQHHKLLCSLLMTCCDLNSSCKTWKSSKAISDLLYTEFFTQGDLEKALGVTPIEMMDRDKAFIPKQQVEFLDGIVGPVYKVLSKLLPSAKVASDSLQSNRNNWAKLMREGRKTPDPELV